MWLQRLSLCQCDSKGYHYANVTPRAITMPMWLQGLSLCQCDSKGYYYANMTPRAITMPMWFQGLSLCQCDSKGYHYANVTPRAITMPMWFQGLSLCQCDSKGYHYANVTPRPITMPMWLQGLSLCQCDSKGYHYANVTPKAITIATWLQGGYHYANVTPRAITMPMWLHYCNVTVFIINKVISFQWLITLSIRLQWLPIFQCDTNDYLLWNYRMYSIRILNVAYNDIMRLLLCLLCHHSASQLFANVNVPCVYAVIMNLIFKFITRLDKSENVVIRCLVKIGVSDLRFTSPYGNTGISLCMSILIMVKLYIT